MIQNKVSWLITLVVLFYLLFASHAVAKETVTMYNFGNEPVQIFKEPDLKSVVIGVIKKGESVAVVMIFNQWAVIEFHGKQAFVKRTEIREKVSFKDLFWN